VKNTENSPAIQREERPLNPIQALTEKRKKIIGSAPEQQLNMLLGDPDAHALVHSFPEQDFYFLIHGIGLDDALPLLSLASNRQWEFILDLEGWHRGRISFTHISRWLRMMLSADPQRLTRWICGEKLELMEHYLFHHVDVAIREHDQDPSDFSDDFVTIDDVLYVRIKPTESASAEDEESHKAFMDEILTRLAAEDLSLYHHMLLESTAILPSEREEEAYHFRNARLADKGFVPFEEALEIYQPLDPAELKRKGRKNRFIKPAGASEGQLPLYPARLVSGDHLFSRALALIDTEAEVIQEEFAMLCNQLISADQRPIRERADLEAVVKKACGYVSIGLEAATRNASVNARDARAASLMCTYPIKHLFRIGYSHVVRLKWHVEKWHRKSWFHRRGLPLGFWGETWLGVLGGMMLDRPRFYEGQGYDGLYREFQSLMDVRRTRAIVNSVKRLDHLLSMIDRVRKLTGLTRHLTWMSVLLTLWARDRIGLSADLSFIPMAAFRPFFDQLWQKESADIPAGSTRRLKEDVREDFIAWISTGSGLDLQDLRNAYGDTLDGLFADVEQELAAVKDAALDSRHIYHFLIS